MTSDNRTSELNKYAGFVARQNHQRDPWRGIGKKCLCGVVFDSDVDHAMHQVEEILRAALVAAQGAAPQAESEHEYLLKALELHQTNSGLPSSTVDEWVYRARISILNSGSHTSPEAARAALDRMIEDHVLELEPEPVFIEKRLRNAWVPVVEAIGGEGR